MSIDINSEAFKTLSKRILAEEIESYNEAIRMLRCEIELTVRNKYITAEYGSELVM